MKSKSLLKILGTLLVIAILAFLVLSDKTITIGGEGKAAVKTTTIAPATTEQTTTLPVAKPAAVAKEGVINQNVVTVPATTQTPVAPTTTTAVAPVATTTPVAPVTTVTPVAQTAPVTPTVTNTATTVTPAPTAVVPGTTTTTPVQEVAKKPLFTFANPFSYKNINLGLDLKGGVSIVYQADTANPDEKDMQSAVELLRKRLNEKNYTEAEVSIQGTNRIRVEIPGIGDPNKAVKEIGRTAELKFYGLTMEQDTALKQKAYSDAQNLFANAGTQTSSEQMYELADKLYVDSIMKEGKLVLRGKDVSSAKLGFDEQPTGQNTPIISLEFSAEGSQKFALATKEFIGNKISIILDGKVLSDPTVQSEITSNSAMITGNFTVDEAKSTAELINSGSLPFELKDIQRTAIEARLGQDALAGSVYAGTLGAILVLVFMIIMYRFPGAVADISLVLYIFLVLGVYSLFNITLTLPGIAGMILSVGIAVDANVIIFSRLKEELNADKTTRAAITAGFHKAMNSIIDGNASVMIIAIILFLQGTGPIKGFGQTLIIGTLVSLFTAIIVTRYMLNSFVDLGIKAPVLFGAKRKSKMVGDLDKK